LNVLFINPNVTGLTYLNFGIAYLSAMLKSAGHRTGLVDLTFGLKEGKIISQTKNFDPDIICISFKSTEYPAALQISKVLKKGIEAPVFCGGVHPTVAPDEVISSGCFDGICIGEGERALLELVTKIEKGENYHNTPNFWFEDGNKVIKNDVMPLIAELDSLPHPDREIFDYEKYLKARDGQADFIFSRGCPFNCTYCINRYLQKLYRGKGAYTRFHSIAYVIDEITSVMENYEMTTLKFEDDTFNADHKRLKEFCETYQKEIGLPFECNLRADRCSGEMFRHLKRAGCEKVNIGVEAGNENIRKNILKRNMSDEQIINAFRLAKKEGVHAMSFNIVGLPYETKEDIQKTIELNKKIDADSIQASIFVPFQGTELYKLCEEKGWLDKEKSTTSYYTGTTAKYPHISQKELLQIRRRFPYECYKDKSRVKASLLLLREYVTPFYLKYGDKMPIFVKKMIYKVIWHSKMFKFLSK